MDRSPLKFISDETRHKYVNSIISYYLDQRGETIGVIAAEDLLDFFLNEIGKEIYKKAIRDTKKLVHEKVEDLELDLDSLVEG